MKCISLPLDNHQPMVKREVVKYNPTNNYDLYSDMLPNTEDEENSSMWVLKYILLKVFNGRRNVYLFSH